ncbi:hypothetical protein ELI36_32500 [Rhizobium ruizarguesonis]|jgi:hypothetical protein|uniref:hypothetical protein n=1 Tax=Rhizobium ruizarguesonis TaxID=2081791 RepID=UPI00102FF985|nr:hypothetical protein [Rhizobium ruizarguesonis]TAV21267.1 hypothetical protein ELI36_32500 [Rhizobium ruizarguesonis]
MNDPHPFRYPRSLREQLNRLERLQPGITFPGSAARPASSFFEMEQTGSTEAELAQSNERLRHLEILIADWRTDGEITFEIDCDLDLRGPPKGVEFDDLPATVCYIQFQPNPMLCLEAPRRARVDGVYVREVAADGRSSVELTFVCQEPGWTTMESCLFADAMKIGARLAVATMPLNVVVPIDRVHRYIDGEPNLTADPALWTAIRLTNEFVSSGCWKTLRLG